MSATPLCDHCYKPMQHAETKSDDGKEIYRYYICGCQNGIVVHKTIHAGQGGR